MAELSINAYAKLNLTLEVVRRLPNGYHELRTVFQQIELCDELTVSDNPTDTIQLTCEGCTLATDSTNLVWKAADLMRSHFYPHRGIHMHLRKRIPVGGGLGGGSADAAATLVGLNRLWRLNLSQRILMNLALKLGMDVPFCLLGGTALGQGRGENLKRLPALPPIDIVIAHPGVPLSTTEAYASLRPEQMGTGEATRAMVAAIQQRDLRAIAARLYNVFEENALRRLPAIGRIKTLMIENGAWNACLSGSGSCVFGLAGSPAEAEAIAAAVRREFPIVFVTRTRNI